MRTEYQLWIFDDTSGWFLRDFLGSEEEARRAVRSWYPKGTTYRIVPVQVL